MNKNYLKHYGMLGMKWGHRKNSNHIFSNDKERRKKIMSSDAEELAEIRKKNINELSNEELRKANNRLNLEQQYSRLNPSKLKKGAMIVGATVAGMNTALNLYNNSNNLIKAGKNIASKLSR